MHCLIYNIYDYFVGGKIRDKVMGALGFEPRSAGLFSGSSLQLIIIGSDDPLLIIP